MSEVSSNLEVLFNKMENFVSTKTVIGDPITIGKVILVPLIDVSFGVGAGAKQNKANKVGSDTKMVRQQVWVQRCHHLLF